MKVLFACLSAIALMASCAEQVASRTETLQAEPYADAAGAVSATRIPTAYRRPCVLEVWPSFLTSGPQSFEARPDIPLGDGHIRPIVFGPIAGSRAKVYMFLRTDDTCPRSAVVVGSYEFTNSLALSNGAIAPGQRRYHSDLYTGNAHYTLGFHDVVAPTYEEALGLARKHLR